MRALVTGAGGFVGPYLIKLLLTRGYQVFGALHKKNLEIYRGNNNFSPVFLDLTDLASVRDALYFSQPDEIYHLAAVAITVGIEPEMYYRVNFQGTYHLLKAVKDIVPRSRVLLASSANAYGAVKKEEIPILESHPLFPNNHYAASKAAAESLACAYFAEGLQVVRARPFNHTGPGQTTDYVCSRLAKEVAEIALGNKEPVIEAGNLDSARDFTDVRDVVEAYWLLLQKGVEGEAYNICSQRAYSIREIINILTGLAGIKANVNSVPALKRRMDIPVLIGSKDKIYLDIGWAPKIKFEDTLKDILDFWLWQLKKE